MVVSVGCMAGPSGRSRLGVRVSYELACPTDVKINDVMKATAFSNGSGFSAGLVYNVPLFYGVYVEPGLKVYYNTYSLNRKLFTEDFAGENLPDGASMRIWGARVPVSLGYKLRLLPEVAVSVFTGVDLDLGLTARMHLDQNDEKSSQNEYGSKGSLNRPDVKWTFGAGVDLGRYVYAGVSGAIGRCDMLKKDYSMHGNRFDITLGFNF